MQSQRISGLGSSVDLPWYEKTETPVDMDFYESLKDKTFERTPSSSSFNFLYSAWLDGVEIASFLVFHRGLWLWNCWNGFEHSDFNEAARRVASAVAYQQKVVRGPKERRRKKISKATRYEIFSSAGFACQACGAKAPDVQLHIDHIIPFSKGGSDSRENYQVLCMRCNLSKGANA